MHALRKCYLFLLIACMATCDHADDQSYNPYRSPCEALLDKLEDCIGGRPSLRGACTDRKAERLLEMSCAEIISNLRGE
jgi:hypothetical protein